MVLACGANGRPPLQEGNRTTPSSKDFFEVEALLYSSPREDNYLVVHLDQRFRLRTPLDLPALDINRTKLLQLYFVRATIRELIVTGTVDHGRERLPTWHSSVIQSWEGHRILLLSAVMPESSIQADPIEQGRPLRDIVPIPVFGTPQTFQNNGANKCAEEQDPKPVAADKNGIFQAFASERI
ncbi:hypothetical protein Tco_0715280 [Tanacetum coccineum]